MKTWTTPKMGLCKHVYVLVLNDSLFQGSSVLFLFFVFRSDALCVPVKVTVQPLRRQDLVRAMQQGLKHTSLLLQPDRTSAVPPVHWTHLRTETSTKQRNEGRGSFQSSYSDPDGMRSRFSPSPSPSSSTHNILAP